MQRFLYVMIATAVLTETSSCSRPRPILGPLASQQSIGAETEKYNIIIQYGYMKDGSVGYIAFTIATKPRQASGIVITSSQKAYLTKPSGERIELPSEVRLFECTDGRYLESKKNVSRAVFEAFLASKPRDYSIRALLAFAEKEGHR